MNKKILILLAVGAFLYWAQKQAQAKALPIMLKGSTITPVSPDNEEVSKPPRDQQGSLIYGNVGTQAADSLADYMADNPAPASIH